MGSYFTRLTSVNVVVYPAPDGSDVIVRVVAVNDGKTDIPVSGRPRKILRSGTPVAPVVAVPPPSIDGLTDGQILFLRSYNIVVSYEVLNLDFTPTQFRWDLIGTDADVRRNIATLFTELREYEKDYVNATLTPEAATEIARIREELKNEFALLITAIAIVHFAAEIRLIREQYLMLYGSESGIKALRPEEDK